MSDFKQDISQNKQRLDEIASAVDAEGVSTEDLLKMLEEAVNIGMDVCEQVKQKVVLEEKPEQATSNDAE